MTFCNLASSTGNPKSDQHISRAVTCLAFSLWQLASISFFWPMLLTHRKTHLYSCLCFHAPTPASAPLCHTCVHARTHAHAHTNHKTRARPRSFPHHSVNPSCTKTLWWALHHPHTNWARVPPRWNMSQNIYTLSFPYLWVCLPHQTLSSVGEALRSCYLAKTRQVVMG